MSFKNRKLFNAVAAGDFTRAQSLIMKGGEASVDMLLDIIKSDAPCTAAVKFLIGAGISPNADTLYEALSRGKKETAQVLLDAKAPVDSRSLRHVINYFDITWVEKLIAAGGKPTGAHVQAAVTRSRFSQDLTVTEVLIKAGAPLPSDTLAQTKLWWDARTVAALATLGGLSLERKKITIRPVTRN